MTQLRAVAPRIYIDREPYVNRYPAFNNSVFYYAGSIVSKSFQVSDLDSDSVYQNFYVAKRDVQPGGVEPESNPDWTIWVSTDPTLQTFYEDSDLYLYLQGLQGEYQVYYQVTDSDLSVLVNKVTGFLGFDSDLNILKHDIGALEERNLIDSLTDSEAAQGKAIAWDSDAQRFKFITPVTSINGTTPDANGNVSYQFTETKTGTRDDRLDSDANGTIFVIVNDSDSDANGVTYAFTDSGWVRLVGYTEAENELLYVNTTGDTMTGPLILSRNPISDSEAATKHYVDGFNDSDKQDRIIIVDNLTQLQALTYENDRIYYVRADNTLWMYTLGTLRQFVIPGQRIFDPVLLEATKSNVIANQFDLDVDTYRFSSFLPGTLTLTKNGTNLSFIKINNINGTYEANGSLSSATLQDAGNQRFTIRVSEIFNNSATYVLSFISHDGVVTSIKLGDRNAVSFSESNRTFNFGEY